MLEKPLKSSASVLVCSLAFLSLFICLLCALLLPVTLDEAYYFMWGQRLSWGYFDHPPAVALLSALNPEIFIAYIGPRFGTLLLGLASFLLAARLFWITRNKQENYATTLLLFKFNIASLAAGILTTPDSFLAFFWILALHEAYRAISGRPRRWLSAGLATGFGLLSKYTMVLMGPIFLFTLLKHRQTLKSPWPYLGGFLAFCIFLPNLKWNSENDWPTFAFQLRRLSSTEIHQNSDLPLSNSNPPSLLEKVFLEHVHELSDDSSKPTPTQSFFSLTPKMRQFLEYFGSLFLLWGFLLLPLLYAFFSFLKKKRFFHEKHILTPEARTLFRFAVAVPIIFFGCISLFTKVEANWSAIYLIAIAPLLSPYLSSVRKMIGIGSVLNCAALLLIATHAKHPLFDLNKDRIMKETYGFSILADHMKTLPEPIFADTYQLVSMLRYYQKDKQILQWPGISRPSEWTHNPQYSYSYAALKEKKEFWLITSETSAPHFESWYPDQMELVKDCKIGILERISSLQMPVTHAHLCPSTHQWLLIHYELASD